MGWDKMAEQRGAEWKVEGVVYLWFCSSCALVHLYSPPRPRGEEWSVSRLCVQEDELGLQTHHIETLSLSAVLALSLTLQPYFSSPAVQTLLLFPTLLISTLSTILPHFHQISHLPLLSPIWKLHARMTCGHISGSGRGEWRWWMLCLSVIRALTQMCQMKMLRSLKFTWTLQSYFVLPVEHVWVCACVYLCIYVIRCMHRHRRSRRFLSVKHLR